MQVVKVTAPNSFALFLVSYDVRFIYRYGHYYITMTGDRAKFEAFCQKHMRPQDYRQVITEVAELSCDTEVADVNEINPEE